MAVLVSPQVKAELDDIWIYIARESASSNIADRVVDTITETFVRLSKHPNLGRRRDDLRQGLRSLALGAMSSFTVCKETAFGYFMLCMAAAISKQ